MRPWWRESGADAYVCRIDTRVDAWGCTKFIRHRDEKRLLQCSRRFDKIREILGFRPRSARRFLRSWTWTRSSPRTTAASYPTTTRTSVAFYTTLLTGREEPAKSGGEADRKFLECVRETRSGFLAPFRWFGVRVGALGIFPTPFRWGYGWRWPRTKAPQNDNSEFTEESQLEALEAKLAEAREMDRRRREEKAQRAAAG